MDEEAPTTCEAQPSEASQPQEEAETSFSAIFGDPVASQIPSEVRSIILEKWHAIRRQLDESRPTVQRDLSLEEKCKKYEETVAQLKEQVSLGADAAEQMADLKAAIDDYKYNQTNLEESCDRLKSEKDSLEKEREKLVLENKDLTELVTRRQEEVNRLHEEQKNTMEELGRAKNAKSEAMIMAEDLESRELALSYREKRLADEREMMEQRRAALNDDLNNCQNELLAVRREMNSKEMQFQSRVNAMTDSIRLLEAKVESLTEDKTILEDRIEETLMKLKDARTSILKVEEQYQQEIASMTKLCELYQSQTKDAEDKSQELESAVQKLQSLLKEASQRYGALEDVYEREKLESKEEIRRRNEAIRVMNKEMEDANALIKTLKHNGLSEESIQQMSPAAASAMNLIKSGMSLTQLYSQLVSSQEQLLTANGEIRRLNSYIEEILSDIEERAPLIKRQKDEYDVAMDTIKVLRQDLEEEQELNANVKQELQVNEQRLSSAIKANDRLQKQVADLSKQVTVLVKEVEASRFGRTSANFGLNLSSSSSSAITADDVISERLTTFKDVEELQQRNIELLAIVREIAAKQELAEKEHIDEKTADMKHEIEVLSSQVEELSEARRRQEALFDNLVLQRDMYKNMVDSREVDTSTPTNVISSTPSSKAHDKSASSPQLKPNRELELRAEKSEVALSQLQKDFDIYREEKCENERLLTEQLEKCRLELNETRAKAIKLASQEEYNTQRFKIAQSNSLAYKKEIGLLEDKVETLHSVVTKHEQATHSLRNELLEAQSKISRMESQFMRTQQELNMLRNSETRLQKENELLHRQKSGSALMENLKMIQVHLEKTSEEERSRLISQVDTLSKEVGLLRKKLDAEQDSYKSAVNAWEQSHNELNQKLDQFQKTDGELKAKVEELKLQNDSLNDQLQAAREKSGDVSASELNALKASELTSQVRALKNEVVSLKELLGNARQASAKYQSLADAAEKQLVDSSQTMEKMRETHEQQLSQAKIELTELSAQLEKVALEKNALEERLQKLEAHGDPVVKVHQSLEVARSELQSCQLQLTLSKELKEQLEQELAKQNHLLQEARQRYENEVIAHGETTKCISQLREQFSAVDEQLSRLNKEKAVGEESLTELKEAYKLLEDRSQQAYSEIKEQFEVVEKENASLHKQLSIMSVQLNSICQSKAPQVHSDQQPDMEQQQQHLVDVIKYLRREKEILTCKYDHSQSEFSRLKGQLEASRKELTESKAALEASMASSHSSILPSSKFADLMEKVQTIPALNDSNRILREEKNKLKEDLSNITLQLESVQKEMEPLKLKLKEADDTENRMSAELIALKADNQRWKQRTNQLIEKHQKINPEELKRLESENGRLSKLVNQYQTQLNQQNQNLSNLTSKIKALEEKWSNMVKSKDAELQKLSVEAQQAKALSIRLNAATKKISEMELLHKQLNAEKDSIRGELEKMQASKATSAEEVETLRKDMQTKLADYQKLVATLEEKDRLLNASKLQINKLKTLGRSFKEKFEKCDKDLKDKMEVITSLEQQLKTAKESAAIASSSAAAAPSSPHAGSTHADDDSLSTQEKLTEAESLVEQSAIRIGELEEEMEKTRDENRKLKETASKATQKEERAKNVLLTAKQKITALTSEIDQLKKELSDMLSARAESSLSEDFEARLRNLRAEKEQIIQEITADKERLQQQVDSLQQELLKSSQSALQAQPHHSSSDKSGLPSVEAVTASVKPVSGVVGQRKQAPVQPQVHVQPTRHIPAQTATIRPTTVIVRSSTQTPTEASLPQISVHPMVSVSPSSSSSSTPSTAAVTTALNPEASDFVPTRQPVASAAEAQEEVRRVMVPPRQGTDEPIATSSTATVAPTQKRPLDPSDNVTSAQEKRARRAQDDVVTVDSSDEEEQQRLRQPDEFEETAEGSGLPQMTDAEAKALEAAEAQEHSESDEDDAEEEAEEEGDHYSDGHEEGSAQVHADGEGMSEDNFDEEEDVEIMDDEAHEDDEPENNEEEDEIVVVDDSDSDMEAQGEVEDEEALNTDSATVEIVPQQGGDHLEESEDSVVPSTPKYMEQRATGVSGTSDAMSDSSAHVPVDPRFVFDSSEDGRPTPSSIMKGLGSQQQMDQTAVDIAHLTVPSTSAASTSSDAFTVPSAEMGEPSAISSPGHQVIDEDIVCVTELASSASSSEPQSMTNPGHQQQQQQQQQRGGRPPRLSRTPIVWDHSEASSSQAMMPLPMTNVPPPMPLMRGRTGTARRSRRLYGRHPSHPGPGK